MKMTGKTVVITGASRGIGEAAAREFAEQGSNVVLLARDAGRIAEIADEIGSNALAVPCDVASFDAVKSAIERTLSRFGSVDVLVNNAGVIAPMAPLAEADVEQWGYAVDVNLKGVFHGVRAVLPQMILHGHGTILNISSGAAHNPYEAWSGYCASKAGAYMLTRQIDLEYRASGIRAIGLSPGTVATQMQRDIKSSGLGPVAELEWSDHIPPAWPARVLVWMCGEEADVYLGQDVKLREPQIRKAIGVA
jgi:NAD(P)-dependent dehydrogenase (short-subunit alcohol dehydrogenase family)